ncbi:MAG: protein kinase [Planctomycetaceae bacterium]|nr:protein kinase [Planctomycetaceae bacterium]
MSFATIDQLGQVLVRSRLVTPEQVEQSRAELSALQQAPDDLLRVMEHHQFLTAYQTAKLKKGSVEGLVLGNYKVMYRNASGSFARVFRACSLTDGQMVGLKVLRQRWASDPKSVQQFHREAELCQKLRHPNIVPIYDVGGDGDFHFFTMEFVEGGNLRDFINIRGKLSLAEATRCVCELAHGLGYALGKGVTHRDLKTTNVLMSATGIAKLVDFGLAGDEQGGGARALEYATIEDATSSPPNDPRSDLFFLGVIYYELLTGQPPYPSTRSREERSRISRYSNIRPIRQLEPNLPVGIEAIVERLLKLDPDQRYQSPQEVAADLRSVLLELGEKPPVDAGSSVATEGNSSPQGATSNGPPTVMCIEGRTKHQDVLRTYLTKHGFRVLMLSDVQRALNRVATSPPDCLILFGDSIGNEIFTAYEKARSQPSGRPGVIAVLSESQKSLESKFKPSTNSRILVQPVKIRSLREAINEVLGKT